MENKFKKILNEHNGILYKIGRSYTKEKVDFEDLYQEMLIQLWRSLDSFQQNSKVSTWVYRVALNTALTYNRNQNRKQNLSSIEAVDLKMMTEDVFDVDIVDEKQRKVELLYCCINLLKKEERAIILLYLNGESYEDISAVIGLPTNHIGVKINRIKKQLHKLLKENNYGKI